VIKLLLLFEGIADKCRQYHDRHTISRLIGAAPGYVGFEEGGVYFPPSTLVMFILTRSLVLRSIDRGCAPQALCCHPSG